MEMIYQFQDLNLKKMNCIVVEFNKFQLIPNKKLIQKYCFRNKVQLRNRQNSIVKKMFKITMNLQFKKKVIVLEIKVKSKVVENKWKNNNKMNKSTMSI